MDVGVEVVDQLRADGIPAEDQPDCCTRLGGVAAGLLFGAGLAISGMHDPAKVLGFLDIAAKLAGQLSIAAERGRKSAGPTIITSE